jgi:hypothetical protein
VAGHLEEADALLYGLTTAAWRRRQSGLTDLTYHLNSPSAILSDFLRVVVLPGSCFYFYNFFRVV